MLPVGVQATCRGAALDHLGIVCPNGPHSPRLKRVQRQGLG